MEAALPVIGVSVWFIAKIMYLIALAVYAVFAIVVVRQVRLMVDTLEVGFELPIQVIAWGHLIFALGVFVLAVIIL